MNPELPELLVCPNDGRELALDGVGAADGDVQDGALSCPDGHRFAIRDGVPRLVPEEAGPLGDQTGTFDSFSAKWSRVAKDEVRQRVEAQHRWYIERFGFGDEDGLRRFLSGKRMVLEAGTGLGGDAARF